MGGAGASADASDSDVPAADLARQVCGRAAGTPSDDDSGTCVGTETSGCESIVRDEAETAKLERLIDTVRRGNPYRLTRSGTLDLPGLAPIPVAGLTPFEATQRLDGREAAAGLPDPADAVAARARAQALRPRPVHDGAVRPSRRS